MIAFFLPFQRFGSDLFRLLPLLYLFWSLPLLFAIVLIVPPGGQADEPDHFARAAHVAAGGLLADKLSMIKVDPAIAASMLPFASARHHPEIKTTAAQFATASSLRWTRTDTDTYNPGAGRYPPTLYVPGALAVALGQAFDLTVLQTFYFARSFNALAAVLVTTVALYSARRTRFALTAVAVLPMTVALYASTSQDALIIALSLLITGILDRVVDEARPASTTEIVVLTLIFASIAMARPIYICLSPIVFVAGGMRDLRLWVACAAIILVTAIWWANVAGSFPLPAGADTAAQLSLLLAQPAHILTVAYRTLDKNLYMHWEQFIGVLGWLDVVLPHTFEHLVEAVLAVSFVSALGGRRRFPLLVALAIITSVGALFGLMYATGTVVGADIVEGVQGRYFIPVAALLPLGLPSFPAIGKIAQPAAALALVLLMICSPGVILQTLVWRHYLGG